MILCKKMYLHIKDIFANTRNIIFSRSDLSSFSILLTYLLGLNIILQSPTMLKLK